MKYIRILHFYLKGIRLLAAVLCVLMTWAMICGVMVFGKIQYINADLAVLKQSAWERAFLLQYLTSTGSFLSGADQASAQNLEETLEIEDTVEQVFTIRTANPVSYQGDSISITLYEPEMLAFFPELNNQGVDFTAFPEGCILASRRFSGLHSGDAIDLSFGSKQAAFAVAGHIDKPYHRLSLATSSTLPHVRLMFTEGDAVIMQASDKVLAQLSTLASRIEYDCNLIVVFKEGVSPEKQMRLLSQAAPDYIKSPFGEIIQNSEEDITRTLKSELPLPVFLAVSAFVSYFSILVLTVEKKKKNISILYLCGYSRKKCGVVAFSAFQIFMVLPVLLCLMLVWIWPGIDWSMLMHGDFTINTKSNIPFYLYSILKNVKISEASGFVILLYYAISVVIAGLVSCISTAAYTPITYLRGTSR